MKASEREKSKERFLASLRTDPNVSLACDVALISRDTAYRWRGGDETFAKAWDDAVERTRDIARGSIYTRGILGWDEPMVSMGQVVCTWEPDLDDEGKLQFDKKGKVLMKRGAPVMTHKWSDSLAALYAKANLPEYKDKPQVNIHAQLADLAETAKQELLADLAQAVADESQEPPHQG